MFLSTTICVEMSWHLGINDMSTQISLSARAIASTNYICLMTTHIDMSWHLELNDMSTHRIPCRQELLLWLWQWSYKCKHLQRREPDHCRGCREIWEALILRTSNISSALVRNQMCTCPRLIKIICAIIICLSIGLVSSDSHLSDKAKIAFRTIGRLFRAPSALPL